MASYTVTTYNEQPFKTLISKNEDGSSLYCVRWSELIAYSIDNWRYNRPPDEVRIPEIKAQLMKQEYVDGVIYLANCGGILICYDGIHRIKALDSLSKDPFNNMMYDHKMFVHYYPDFDEQKIKHKFETLNKNIPVPNIYSEADRQLDCISTIKDVVLYFTGKYKAMFKPSKNPNVPHVNRDIFTNHVENIIKELNIYSFDSRKIVHLFEEYNALNKADYRIHKKLTCKQLTKCFEHNCFIFADKHWPVKFVKAFMDNKIVMRRNI
tara:strand:+ start:1762 stop:2559 length:798 start_codon:yes stop_codon:yes gene_type:complete